MAPEPTCPRCSQSISPRDTVEIDRDRVVHFDCRLPQRLSREERALLFHYCWDHPVADCVPCARRFRQHELLWGPLAGNTDRCPRCLEDVTESLRAHLYSCSMLPTEVRRRAQELRATSRQLVKDAGQLRDRADVLMRETEVALALLRDAMRESAVEGLLRIIRVRLADGSLPHEGIPATIRGRPGDGSICGACDHIVTNRDLMMVVTREEASFSSLRGARPIALHAGCFELWNTVRRKFTSSF
jgi:hypothetical protein